MSKKNKNNTTEPQIDLSICRVCNRTIEVAAFKNTGFCCGNCQKFFRGEKIAKRVVAPVECDTSMPVSEVNSTAITNTK